MRGDHGDVHIQHVCRFIDMTVEVGATNGDGEMYLYVDPRNWQPAGIVNGEPIHPATVATTSVWADRSLDDVRLNGDSFNLSHSSSDCIPTKPSDLIGGHCQDTDGANRG